MKEAVKKWMTGAGTIPGLLACGVRFPDQSVMLHNAVPDLAPATLEILAARGVSLSQCEEPRELVTPTGAALLAELVESFGPMRGLVPSKVGYGLGTRDNQTRPNVLRAILGGSEAEGNDWETDTIATVQASSPTRNRVKITHQVERRGSFGSITRRSCHPRSRLPDRLGPAVPSEIVTLTDCVGAGRVGAWGGVGVDVIR